MVFFVDYYREFLVSHKGLHWINCFRDPEGEFHGHRPSCFAVLSVWKHVNDCPVADAEVHGVIADVSIYVARIDIQDVRTIGKCSCIK